MTGRLLYWGSGSIPCWKAMLVLAEKGIDYTAKQISFDDNGTRGPEVLALNPRGQVPTFKDGDLIINESNAICFYLEESYKSQGTQLIPSDRKLKGMVLQKAFEAVENLNAKQQEAIPYYIWDTKEEDRDQELLKKRYDICREELKLWEKYLGESGSNFAVGDSFTMADVFLFPYVAFAWRMSLNFDRWPNIKGYFNRLKDRPSVKKTWPPHWNVGEPQPAGVAFLKEL